PSGSWTVIFCNCNKVSRRVVLLCSTTGAGGYLGERIHMSHRIDRRDFLKTSGAAAGFWIAGRQLGYGQEKSPNAKVNVGHIGVAGMRGADHLGQMASQSQIALCDVDEKNLEQGAVKLPKAAKYHDFREMLEKEKSLDCIVISTPDHIHAPAG